MPANDGGRSAFITRAVLCYLRDKQSAGIDEQFRIALTGKADDLLAEVEPFLEGQVWPDDEGPGGRVARRRKPRRAR